MIYQLAKTSVGLGGNLKLDLIANKIAGNEIRIDNIQLSPISECIHTVDNYRDNESILNHTHLYNLKSFYKSYSSNFYSTYQNYSNCSWIYNEHPVDTMNNDFDMRAHRVRYNKYNKQFAFFLPLWISEKIDFSKLEFKLSIAVSEGKYKNIILSTTIIKLNNKIAEYLNEYITGISDNLLNLNYKLKTANIFGVDVSSARKCSKDVSYIWESLLEREVPLIQNDYKIYELFTKNNIIAQQIFNFDVLFNVKDLIPQSYVDTLYGNTINYYIDVYYNNKKIELKDIYSNYEYIPKTEKNYYKYHNSYKYSDTNVLDYLEDYKESNSIYFNKITQSVFHWSLVSNNDYILNLYNGFSPVVNVSTDASTDIIKSGYYRDSNLLYRNTYNDDENNLNWCELYNYSDKIIDSNFLSSFNISKSYDSLDKKDYTKIIVKYPITWIGKHQFEINNKDWVGSTYDVAIMLVQGYTTDFESSIGNKLVKLSNYTYIYVNNSNDNSKKYIIISSKTDELLVANLADLILNSESQENIKILGNILSEYIMPETIRFTKTVFPRLSYFNNISYYKQDENYDVRLYRYFGNFIPCFIDIDDKNLYNYKYYYNVFSDTSTDDYKQYSKYILDKYTPVYPSLTIGENTDGTNKSFYGLSKNILTSNYTDFKVSNNSIYDTYKGDICYLKDNRIRLLPEKVYFEKIYSKNAVDIEESFYDDLAKYVIGDKEVFNKYYKKYYKINIEYDYASETDINKILYKVTFELS